jgi:DNA-binding CsgD family transcriptional regulator
MRVRTRADRAAAQRATEREVLVVAAVLVAGSEKAAAHRLGLSHSTVKHHLANARSKVGAETTAQLVWILAPRLPEPASGAQVDDLQGWAPSRSPRQGPGVGETQQV